MREGPKPQSAHLNRGRAVVRPGDAWRHTEHLLDKCAGVRHINSGATALPLRACGAFSTAATDPHTERGDRPLSEALQGATNSKERRWRRADIACARCRTRLLIAWRTGRGPRWSAVLFWALHVKRNGGTNPLPIGPQDVFTQRLSRSSPRKACRRERGACRRGRGAGDTPSGAGAVHGNPGKASAELGRAGVGASRRGCRRGKTPCRRREARCRRMEARVRRGRDGLRPPAGTVGTLFRSGHPQPAYGSGDPFARTFGSAFSRWARRR